MNPYPSERSPSSPCPQTHATLCFLSLSSWGCVAQDMLRTRAPSAAAGEQGDFSMKRRHYWCHDAYSVRITGPCPGGDAVGRMLVARLRWHPTQYGAHSRVRQLTDAKPGVVPYSTVGDHSTHRYSVFHGRAGAGLACLVRNRQYPAIARPFGATRVLGSRSGRRPKRGAAVGERIRIRTFGLLRRRLARSRMRRGGRWVRTK